MRDFRGLLRAGKALYLDSPRQDREARNTLAELERSSGVAVEYGLGTPQSSSLPIDVLIPVIDKDADSLPFVIDSARTELRHPLGTIFLVCPEASPRIKEIARDRSCTTIDEAGLLPIGKKDIAYAPKGVNRSGWIYQQFLKWCGDSFVSQRHYLILDSDTVLIRPHVFEAEGRQIFDCCDEVHHPYFAAAERVLGRRPSSSVSFTSHHALIDLGVMAELKAELEARHGRAWYEAIIRCLDPQEISSHSDYDTYGFHYFERHREAMKVRYWYNKSLRRADLTDLEGLKKIYKSRYRTLSFHEHRK